MARTSQRVSEKFRSEVDPQRSTPCQRSTTRGRLMKRRKVQHGRHGKISVARFKGHHLRSTPVQRSIPEVDSSPENSNWAELWFSGFLPKINWRSTHEVDTWSRGRLMRSTHGITASFSELLIWFLTAINGHIFESNGLVELFQHEWGI